MSKKIEITSVWLKEKFATGMTKAEVLDEVNAQLDEDNKLSIGRFTKEVKKLGINIRTKPKSIGVSFVSVEEAEETPVVKAPIPAPFNSVEAVPVSDNSVSETV